MKISYFNIFLVFIFFIGSQMLFCQPLKINYLDKAYKEELLLENNALKIRISNFPIEAKVINTQIAQSVRDKDYVKALSFTFKLEELLPDNADVKNFKAKMYYKQSNLDLALKAYTEAIYLNPKNKWFYINKAGILAEEDRFKEAIEVVDQLLLIEESWSIAYNVKASLLLYLNKYDESLAVFNKALVCKPESAQIYTNRGDLYLEMNDIEKAVLDYKMALEIQPDYHLAKEKLNLISTELN